jgi:hypothetical protein
MKGNLQAHVLQNQLGDVSSLTISRLALYLLIVSALNASIVAAADRRSIILPGQDHHFRAATKPFDPEHYCVPLEITSLNTNIIVRELIALRTRRSLSESKPAGRASETKKITTQNGSH